MTARESNDISNLKAAVSSFQDNGMQTNPRPLHVLHTNANNDRIVIMHHAKEILNALQEKQCKKPTLTAPSTPPSLLRIRGTKAWTVVALSDS